MVVRKGIAVVHYEEHNGWPLSQTAGRLKQLAHQYGVRDHARNDERRIPILIDVGGLGAGVVDMADGYNFVGVNSACESDYPQQYPNMRSQLWFSTVEYARAPGGIDVSRIGAAWEGLRDQLLAPKYSIDLHGRCVVEPKEDTKEVCGRSPDGADALNLAFLVSGAAKEKVIGKV